MVQIVIPHVSRASHRPAHLAAPARARQPLGAPAREGGGLFPLRSLPPVRTLRPQER
ncbi:hypothetical protein F0U59_25425 [Archangium gephyra]|nr:hypothetical protein F0U59_25425 [Archangium gephyra]